MWYTICMINIDNEERATVYVKRGTRDLIKINATYRKMTIDQYLVMLAMKDLDLKPHEA